MMEQDSTVIVRPSADLARERLRRLDSEKPAEADYYDFFLEGDRLTVIDEDGSQRAVDQPWRPPKLHASSVVNTPPILLPDGRYFFYCRAKAEPMRALLQEEAIANGYVADSWLDLFRSNYRHWGHVFHAETDRPTLDARIARVSIPARCLVPGDRVLRFRPQGLFAGTDCPDLPIEGAPASVIPKTHAAGPTQGSFRYQFLFVDAFGVDLEDADHVDLSGGMQWWPGATYPYREFVSADVGERQSEPVPITGVLLLPIEEVKPTPEASERRRQRARRLVAALDLIEGATMRIVAESSVVRRDDGSSQWRFEGDAPFTYSHATTGPALGRMGRDSFLRVAEIAFAEYGRKRLGAAIQRSLDTWALAQTLLDIPISLPLLWAGIEALISPTEHSELISNNTLALMGLEGLAENPVRFFRDAKESYGVRSDIVHSFSLPDEEKLLRAREFAQRAYQTLLNEALKHESESQRHHLGESLRNTALQRFGTLADRDRTDPS